jgi:hypothetical protein
MCSSKLELFLLFLISEAQYTPATCLYKDDLLSEAQYSPVIFLISEAQYTVVIYSC